MSTELTDPGHGNSPAAWTAVIIMLIAVAAGAVAFYFEMPWVVVGCVGLLVVGLIVGWIMARLGYGVRGPKYVPKGH